MNLEASNVTEYLVKIKEVYDLLYQNEPKNECGSRFNNGLFFRGQANCKHKLTPSILRSDEDIKSEKTVLFNFRDYMPQQNLSFDFIRERIEILAWMQHYRIPTRLLDWSFSPLVSLYFACNGEEQTDGAVFAFNPWKYNEKEIFEQKPKTDEQNAHIYARALMTDRKDNLCKIRQLVKNEYDIELDEESLKKPFPFVSAFNNPRIIHQKGCFTIHGMENNDIEAQLSAVDRAYLTKIVIKNTLSIKRELSLLFINEYSIYPDFEGMARQLKEDKSLYKVHFSGKPPPSLVLLQQTAHHSCPAQ